MVLPFRYIGVTDDACENRDPADRILIATAVRYQLSLVTADETILRYAAEHPRLTVMDARRN